MTKACQALDPRQTCARLKTALASHFMHYIKLPSKLSGKLTPAQLSVLFTLASFGPAEHWIQGSISEISHFSGVCRKNITRTLRELEQMNLLSIQEQPGYANLYFVHAVKP